MFWILRVLRGVLWWIASDGFTGLVVAQNQREAQAAARVEIIPPNEAAFPLAHLPYRRPLTIRARLILLSGTLCALCVVLAYATGNPPLVEGPSYLAHDDATLSCNYVSSEHGTFDIHKPDYSPQCMRPVRGEWVRSTGSAEPNFLFLFLAFWPGLVAVVTALGSWTLTGRLW